MIQKNYKNQRNFLTIALLCLVSASAQLCAKKNLPSTRLTSQGQLGKAGSASTQTPTPVYGTAKPAPVLANQITAQDTTVKEDSQPAPEKNESPAKDPSAAWLEPDVASVIAQEPLEDTEASISKEAETDEGITFNFENADMQNLVSYMADLFKVTFITDDAINPMLPTGKAISGNKISFKTQRPLSRQAAWNLFLTFLDMAGLGIIQEGGANNIYRITATATVIKSPIPAFIGTDPTLLPDNDAKIRYIYFLENGSLESITGIVTAMKSKDAPLVILQELKAFMITDSAYNIKTLMKIVKQLDQVSAPQAMSALRLKWVDALDAKKLVDSLIQPDGAQQGNMRIFGPRKPSTAKYFPEDAYIFAEPRTNMLIILGSQQAITKIEQFVTQYIDTEISAPYSPLHTYQLKYAQAETVAAIMNNVTVFGQKTPAGASGGIRGEDKYLKSMTFTAEPTGNRLIVRGDYDDFLKAKEIIEKLDEAQPQVAIEILILSVDIDESKELGAQLRNKWRVDANGNNVPSGPNGFLGNNVSFQTSGLRAGAAAQGVITNTNPAAPGAQQLLGDLIQLVVGKAAGNTILSLGADQFGVWGIFQALQEITNLQVESNPFLITSNKTPAQVQLGNTRRVVTGIIKGTTDTNTFADSSANLTVNITPQINSDGMITLALDIQMDEFTNVTDPSSGTKSTKRITTNTIVADKEVLALGGLIRNSVSDNQTKVPILGDIPLIGWLFKNKRKEEIKSNLLILISTRIIDPLAKEKVDIYTKGRITNYENDLSDMGNIINRRDIVDRTFFKESNVSKKINGFIFEESATRTANNNRKMTRREKKRQKRSREVLKNSPQEAFVITQNQPTQQSAPTSPTTSQAAQIIAAVEQPTQQTPKQPVPQQPAEVPVKVAMPQKTLPKRKTKNASLADFVGNENRDEIV